MTVTINGTTGITDVNGTAAAPAITGTDTDTGIFFPAANTLAFSTGGTEDARFDASGNLGVGTSSPSAKLTVQDANGFPIRFGDIASAPASQTAAYIGISTSALSGFNGDLVLVPRTSAAGSVVFYTGNGTSAERARIDSSGQFYTSDGAGNVKSAYVCRAWVSFDGTTASPSTIRGSGNVSSVTKNGTGDYTVNLTTAMSDANYAVTGTVSGTSGNTGCIFIANSNNSGGTIAPTTSAVRCASLTRSGGAGNDTPYMSVSIFR